MHTILVTPSLSWAESVHLALATEGIEASVLDQHSAVALSAGGGLRVIVHHATDVDRARRVVSRLVPPPAPLPPSWRWHRHALRAFACGFAALFLNYILADVRGWEGTRMILGIACLVLFVTSFLLVRHGNGADRQVVSAGSDTP